MWKRRDFGIFAPRNDATPFQSPAKYRWATWLSAFESRLCALQQLVLPQLRTLAIFSLMASSPIAPEIISLPMT